MENTEPTKPENLATKVTVLKIVAYCKRENAMQMKVYPARIESGKMKQDDANLYYNIIKQIGQLADKCEAKGISWEALNALVDRMQKV